MRPGTWDRKLQDSAWDGLRTAQLSHGRFAVIVLAGFAPRASRFEKCKIDLEGMRLADPPRKL
jgi:hypothetical protein